MTQVHALHRWQVVQLVEGPPIKEHICEATQFMHHSIGFAYMFLSGPNLEPDKRVAKQMVDRGRSFQRSVRVRIQLRLDSHLPPLLVPRTLAVMINEEGASMTNVLAIALGAAGRSLGGDCMVRFLNGS